MKLGMRETVRYVASRSSCPYMEHLEESFSACIRFIKAHHPDADLVHVGSDMGGPIWEVRDECV